MDVAQTIEEARTLRGAGFFCVPIPSGSKGPVAKGWQDQRLDESAIDAAFVGGLSNIGVLLGEPSGWLVDVDLDCEEAVRLAPQYLPATGCVTGRDGRPASHWWYACEGAETERLKDDNRKTDATVVELRSTGAQTVVGPSVHPEGGQYDLLRGERAIVPYGMLKACVAALHQAVMKDRYEDSIGSAVGSGGGGSIGGDSVSAALCPREQNEDRPGDQFNANATADNMLPLLQHHGWTMCGRGAEGIRLCRPGKKSGVSATLYPDGTLYCFTSSTQFPAEKGVAPFAVYTALEHGGDFSEASRALASEYESQLPPVKINLTIPPATVPEYFEDDEDDEPEADDDAATIEFPGHLLNVPGFIGDVMQHTLETAPRPQPVLSLFAAISLQAVLAGRKIADIFDNRTNLYIVGLAKSGKGKNHPRVINRAILRAAGLSGLEGPEDLASDAGLISAVATSPACLLQLDEVGRMLKAAGAAGAKAPHLFGINTQLMRLYSSSASDFKGKAYADSKKNTEIIQPCLTLFGTTVASAFWGSMNSDSLSDGFLARLIPAIGDDNPARQSARKRRLPEYIIERARWWGEYSPGGNVASQPAGTPDPQVYEYTPEAQKITDEWADKWEALGDANEDWQPVWCRCLEKAFRLALVYAASKDPNRHTIDADAATWACEVSDVTTRQFVQAGERNLSDSEFQLLCKQALELFRKRGKRGLAPSLVGRFRPFNRLNARQQDEVLQVLMRNEQIVRAVRQNGRSAYVLRRWAD